jgi:hypothetical protein
VKTERTEIEGLADKPCAACPWLTANHRRPHPEGWYSDANRRRLWNGLRTGEAPGMTCHPTDPENQPVGEHVVTRECTGAWLLIAKETKAFEESSSFAEYRRGRKLAMTRGGFLEAISALMPPPFGRGLKVKLDDAPVSIGLGTGR